MMSSDITIICVLGHRNTEVQPTFQGRKKDLEEGSHACSVDLSMADQETWTQETPIANTVSPGLLRLRLENPCVG